MAVEVGQAFVSIVPSAKGFSNRLQGQLSGPLSKAGAEGGKKYGSGMSGALGGMGKRIFAPIAAAAAGVGIASFFKDAVKGASDLNETSTKMQAIFGAATGDVVKFASKGAEALGQTQQAVEDSAASFGVFGKAAGLTGGDLAKFSTGFAGLSTDLASFFNTNPADAATAISAGLRGEAEPLRQYGVLLDDATLRTEALKLGLVKTTKEALTPQQKVLAAQSAIYKQTSDAQGDFQRTSGGLANQQRILAAQFADMRTNLGKALLPIVVRVVTGFNHLFTSFKDGKGPLAVVGKGVKVVQDAIGGLFSLVVKGDFTHAMAKAFNISDDSPIVGTLLTIRKGFIDALPVVKKFVTDGLGELKKVGAGLLTTLAPVFAQLPGLFEKILPVITTVAKVIGDTLQGAFAKIGPTITLVAPIVIGLFEKIAAAVQFLAPVLGKFIVAVVDLAETFVQKLLPPIASVARQLLEMLVPALKSIFTTVTHDIIPALKDFVIAITPVVEWLLEHLMPVVRVVFGVVVRVIKAAMKIIGGIIKLATSLIKGDWRGAWNAIKQIFSGVWDAIKAIATGAFKIMRSVFSTGLQILGKVWGRAWDGLKAVASKAWDGIKWVISKALGAVKKTFRDAVAGIGRIWDGLKAIAKAPIRFIVNTVLNDGLIDAFNWISGKVGGPSIGHIPLPAGFARGGWTGPGSRLQPAGIVHADEYVIRKSSRRRIEQLMPGLLDYINKRGTLPPGHSDGGRVGLPGYAGGGLVGGLKAVFDALRHPLTFFKHILESFIDKASGVLDSPFGDIVKAVPGKVLGAMVEKIKGLFTSSGVTHGGTGVARWGALIQRAMVMTGMPAGTFDNWMRQIASESGGNPNAVQGNIGDVNNRSGDLAKGLLQVIGATFAAYRDPRLPDDRFDPLANAVAAMRYARSRYGINSIEGVIGHGHGYAAGTASARPGLAMVGERGPELVRFGGGEQVLSNRDLRHAGLTVEVNGGVHGFTAREVAVELDRLYRQRETLAFAGRG